MSTQGVQVSANDFENAKELTRWILERLKLDKCEVCQDEKEEQAWQVFPLACSRGYIPRCFRDDDIQKVGGDYTFRAVCPGFNKGSMRILEYRDTNLEEMKASEMKCAHTMLTQNNRSILKAFPFLETVVDNHRQVAS